jgi:AraC-like DNA-binding protein
MAVFHSRDESGAFSTIREDGPTPVTVWHAHTSLVLGRVVAGWRRLYIAGTSYLLKAGDGFVIPPDQAHAWGREDASVHLLVVDPVHHPVPACASAVIRDDGWRNAFDCLLAARQKTSPEREAAVAVLLERTTKLAPSRLPRPLKANVLRRARQFAVERLDESLTLAALGREVGLSPWHLHRLYRTSWGVPPAEHRLEARLRLVRLALLDGASVAQAAAIAGFADQSHLCRAFRRLMGVPPRTWLRQIGRRA